MRILRAALLVCFVPISAMAAAQELSPLEAEALYCLGMHQSRARQDSQFHDALRQRGDGEGLEHFLSRRVPDPVPDRLRAYLQARAIDKRPASHVAAAIATLERGRRDTDRCDAAVETNMATPCAKTCTTRATLPGGQTSWPVYFQCMAACPGYEQMVSTCEPLNSCESIERRLPP